MAIFRAFFLRLGFAIKYGTFRPLAEDSSKNLIACGQTLIGPIPKRCPHQGAPLKNSYLKENFLVCHWHGCLFDLEEQKWIRSPQCQKPLEKK
jgi:hypothetical protein